MGQLGSFACFSHIYSSFINMGRIMPLKRRLVRNQFIANLSMSQGIVSSKHVAITAEFTRIIHCLFASFAIIRQCTTPIFSVPAAAWLKIGKPVTFFLL